MSNQTYSPIGVLSRVFALPSVASRNYTPKVVSARIRLSNYAHQPMSRWRVTHP